MYGLLYFYFQNTAKAEEKGQPITYETINMITNIRLGISEFDTIHPYKTKNREVIYIDTLIFEPLLTITQDYHIETCLAKEWSKVDEKSYVIKLKENIRWSNKEKVSTQDIKFSIEELQKRKNSVYYENVKDIEKIQIIDEHTIRIDLSKEIPFFEYRLIFPIVSAKENEKQIPIGTGKYKIVKLEEDKIELSQNENYREEENSNIKNISIMLYKTMGEVYNDFKLGNIDLFHTTNKNIEEYIGSMGYGKKIYAGREYDYLALNCEDSLLQYREVRKAIAYALDKKRIIATSLEEKVEPAQLPLEGTYLTKEVSVSSNKIEKEKAKKVLEEAGWKYEYGIWQKQIAGRTKTLNITLTVSKSNEQRVKVAQEIKKQLEEIGIKIKIQEVSDNQYQNYLKNVSYEMILTGVYSAISPDLTEFLGKGNLANYQNQEVENILKELNNITQEELRKEKYKRLFQILEEEVPYISLYRNQEFVIYNTTFRGEVAPNHYNIYYNFSNWYRQE